MYLKPIVNPFKAIQWGIDNEEKACLTYKKYMNANGHEGLYTEKAGFLVSVFKGFLGVSPDTWVGE